MQDKPNRDYVYAQPKGFDFTYYLSDSVQDSNEYHECLQLLDSASENDTVRIVINNFGGEMGTCVQLVDHIRGCKARVVGHISGNAFSAAAIIFMACDVQELGSHPFMMIHNAVGYASGKYTDMQDYILASNKHTRELYEDVFKHFLTPVEMDKVFDGKEMWLCYDELVERLERRQKLFTDEAKEIEEKAYAEAMAEFEQDDLPESILKKLTKLQLIRYIQGEIDVHVEEDGKISIVEIQEDEINS